MSKTDTTKFKVGDLVRVKGAADILTIEKIVSGSEEVAVFKEGGFWRTCQLRRLRQPMKCEGCSSGIADLPSSYCPGCQAYREHQQ